MYSFLTNKRNWFVVTILAALVFLALAPAGRVMADTNPYEPPISAPADPGTTPPDTTVVPEPLAGTDSLTTWDIFYAIIVAL